MVDSPLKNMETIIFLFIFDEKLFYETCKLTFKVV